MKILKLKIIAIGKMKDCYYCKNGLSYSKTDEALGLLDVSNVCVCVCGEGWGATMTNEASRTLMVIR